MTYEVEHLKLLPHMFVRLLPRNMALNMGG